jgi:NADH-quinone oxidoreductase subunit D
MAKELYDGIYSSHKLVFIERVEKNLEFYLKNKIVQSKRLGQEILCIVSKENLQGVLGELRDNPEFNVQILNNISKYQSSGDTYVLINLSSVINNFSLLLKIKLSSGLGPSLNREYIEIINIVKIYFESAIFYKERPALESKYSDVTMFSPFIDGFDFLDIYLLTNDDTIEKAYIDTNIARVVADDFYINADIEKLLSYVSRFDYTAGIFPELCFCIAMEELMQLKVQKRVQSIRMIVGELFRISNHLHFIVNICKIMGNDTVYNLALLERERVFRVIELITGSRINPNFVRIGGIRKDLNEEKLKNIKENLPTLALKVSRIETMLLDNSIITGRLKDIGIIDRNTALEYGVTGPNLRSLGIRYDLRKNRNLLLYKDISFLIPLGKYGDCLDRVQVRFGEIYQSIKIVEQIAYELPEEHIKKLINLSELEFPFSSMISSIECPHGVFKIYIEVKENTVSNMVLMGPSRNSLFLAEKILEGNRLEDVEIVLGSLDLSCGEIVRF